MSARRSALTAHWLALVNLAAGLFVALPFAAPVLLGAGHADAASLIYGAYRVVCHQWAFRSYFLFGPESTYAIDALAERVGADQVFSFVGSPELGYKVAFCERDVAIYLAVLAAGLVYAARRRCFRPLIPTLYLALILPIALDGFTQLFGLRESTVLLRTLTGALFGVASVWLIYPRLDRVFTPELASLAPVSPPLSPPNLGAIGRAKPVPKRPAPA